MTIGQEHLKLNSAVRSGYDLFLVARNREMEREIMIAYQRISGRAQASDKSNCKDPDSELVVRAQAGDRDAFELLVLQHKESISRVIFRITKNREDAEDEVQKTFLRAYRGLREFLGNSKFTSWLTRIAVN